MPTKIFVTGAKGKMGQRVVACAQEDPEIEVAGTLEINESIKDSLRSGMVVIDFSTHTAIPTFVSAAAELGCPMVIGTTGFTYKERDPILKASKVIPIVMTPNMSVGVNLLFTLTQMVASVIHNDFDVEIIEKHHRSKKDAPSGTAVHLAEIIAKVKDQLDLDLVKYGRHGDHVRAQDEIGMHSIRGGDFVGEHIVIFAGNGETVEITHKANSRDIFAKGALKAAKWITSAQPGLYNMQDVLGLQVTQQVFS